MVFLRSLFLVLILLTGCQRSALIVQQMKVTPAYLASANIGAPDPRTPPNGQMIVAEWWLSKKVMECCPCLQIEILFCDFTTTCVEYPISQSVGYETYCLFNNEFKEKGGLLAYRARVVGSEGDILKEWKHQLWVKLIQIDDDLDPSEIEKIKHESLQNPQECCED